MSRRRFDETFKRKVIQEYEAGGISCYCLGKKYGVDAKCVRMGNCITLEDTNGNRKLLKRRYDQKIDAVAAMMDGYVAYKLNKDAFE